MNRIAIVLLGLTLVACKESSGPVKVASVSISPAVSDVEVGSTTQLVATVRDDAGNTLSGRTVIWSSSNTSIASVSAGLVIGINQGTALITATSEEIDGVATVHVTPPQASQSELDNWLAYWIESAIWDVYNQNIAGRSGGSQDVVAACPNGGTVHITGTASRDAATDLTSVNLTFDMSDCEVSKTYGDITMTTVATQTGSFHSDDQFTSVNFQSSSAELLGTLQVPNKAEVEIDDTCAFDINRTSNASGSNAMSAGSICGRDYSFTASSSARAAITQRPASVSSAGARILPPAAFRAAPPGR